jgi:hypothetical protein
MSEINCRDGLEEALTSAMHTAASERRQTTVEYGIYSHNTVKSYAYRIRRELGYVHTIRFEHKPDGIVFDTYKLAETQPPTRLEVKPGTTKAVGPVATVNQVITRKVPTGEHLAAYRILIDAGILDCVEILDYSKEKLESDFPGVKAFMLEDTKKGVLLL